MTPPPLFKHQQELLDKTWELPAWAVFFEQGTGKTAPTIHTAARLFNADRLDAAIVVAPNGVHRNWIIDEIPKHCPIAWKGIDWHSSRGKGQDKALAQLLETPRRSALMWFAITYEALLTPRGRAAVLAFKEKYPRFMAICDEGSRIKNAEALRTKKCVALRDLAAYARILNGTPIGNSALDAYSQLRFLDKMFWIRHGIASWTAFRSRFAVLRKIVVGGEDDREADEPAQTRARYDDPHDATPDGVDLYEQLDLTGILEEEKHQPKVDVSSAQPKKGQPKTIGRTIEVVVGFRELDKLKEMIAPISTRITKEDAGLDLPPKLYSRIVFDLLPEQRRVYDTLRKEFMVELDNGALVTAPLALTRIMRLQQIACGYLPNPDDPDHPKLFFNADGNNPRLQQLLELLEDTPHQAIIWARFTQDIDAICRALGPPKCARYDGEVSETEKARSIDRFRAGKAKFMIAKTASMGVGLTLNEAKSVFYYSNTFSYYERTQSEDRCHRVGQTNPVTYYDLEAYKTVDGRILKALKECADVASKVTGDSLRTWFEES